MKKPKVVLKNIKTFRGMEGYGMNADVFINNVKCLFVMDAANGGQYDYEENITGDTAKVIKNIKLLKDYIETLPEEKYDMGGKEYSMKIDMDMYLDNVLNEQERVKNEKKMLNLSKSAILIGVPDASTYSYIKTKIPLFNIPTAQLQKYVDNVKQKHCTDDKVILNTNLTALGITI